MAQTPPAPGSEPTPALSAPAPRSVVLASYLLVAAALLLVLWRGLLPGLLCVCLGFLLTRAWVGWLTRLRPGALPPLPRSNFGCSSSPPVLPCLPEGSRGPSVTAWRFVG